MKRTLCLLASLATTTYSAESTLKGFEASSRETGTHSVQSYDSHHGHSSAELDANIVLAVLAMTLYGSAESLARVNPSHGANQENITPRHLGEPLIPFATVEGDYHYVNDKIDGTSGAFEVGYGPFAFRMRQERFSEKIPGEPEAELKLTEKIGLLRLSGGDAFELDLGGGEITLDGDTTESQAVFTSPLRLRLADWLAVSFRPTWGRSISIYDAAIEPGFNFLRLRLGYRWTKTDGESLSGPYAGASLTF